MAARLRRRGAPPDVADDVVADLTARGYLDDEAFARHWVAARAPRGYGPARLRAELRARGVDTALIEAALAGVSDDGELERARAVARRRLPALQRGDRARAAARLRDHLLRRGYPASVVTRVVRECVGLRLED
jgi:regulatory protein